MTTSPSHQKTIPLAFLLALITLALYWPAKNFEFISYDDPVYFTANPHVQGGLTLENLRWAFTTHTADNWHPLTWLSLMANVQCFGNGPAPAHFINVLLHAANAALVFLLFRLMTGFTAHSFLVAALFAWHPLRVESVVWVAERKDVLCMFFELLTLLTYVFWARRRPNTTDASPPPGKPAAKFYFLSLAFCALALLSKPMAVTLPCLLLLLDFWPLHRLSLATARRCLLEKIPFFLLCALGALGTWLAEKSGGGIVALHIFSVSARIENAFVSYARYLGKTIWPASLALPYPHPNHWPLGIVLLSVMLFVTLCLVAVFAVRKFRFPFTGWFWFIGTLVPAIGLVQVGTQSMADRHSYLPHIGLFALIVWTAAELRARLGLPRFALLFIPILALSLCVAQTRRQLAYWKNDFTLFNHSLQVTRSNYVASIHIGFWYSSHNQLPEAARYYHDALAMAPDDPTAIFDAANALLKMGQVDEAIASYRRILKITNQYDIRCNLGYALAMKKNYPEAAINFQQAVQLEPNSAFARNNLASMLVIQGNFSEAAEQFRTASTLDPRNPQILLNLADVYLHLNDLPHATESYQKVLTLNPTNTRAQIQLRALSSQ